MPGVGDGGDRGFESFSGSPIPVLRGYTEVIISDKGTVTRELEKERLFIHLTPWPKRTGK